MVGNNDGNGKISCAGEAGAGAWSESGATGAEGAGPGSSRSVVWCVIVELGMEEKW